MFNGSFLGVCRILRFVKKIRFCLLETGRMLALLKDPFYPLFILDNGMNSESKSLTVLTPS